MTEATWTVHKFGGTSLASAARYRGAAQILIDRDERPCAVVVSAMGGLTDALVELVEDAARRRGDLDEGLAAVRARLLETLEDLLEDPDELAAITSQDLSAIRDLLRASWLLRSWSPQTMDVVSGFGELWSAQTLCAHLNERGVEAAWLDAREVLAVDPPLQGLTPRPRLEEAGRAIQAWLDQRDADPEILVITGFIASTPDGLPTTLGRNGSDFSASIFSALLGAPELYIWTDVDGVMSANPRLVPEAHVLAELSYQEAMELAYFGASVLHPSTIAPAVAAEVTVTIKNTFAPEVPGTRISAHGSADFAIKGFTTVDDIALVNLEGTNMLGVPGIASRLFGALREAQVSVIMISQASSEHSICFAVPSGQAERVREVVEHAFFAERHQGQLQTLEIVTPCSILAAVGDQMAGQVGLAGRLFEALGNAGVNIRAIAQGSSERNVSVVVDQREAQRALRAAHSSFYLSHKTLSIGLIGPGTVGAELLDQLAAQAEALREQAGVDLRVRAVATSSRMLLEEIALDLEGWSDALEDRGEPVDLARLAAHVGAEHLPHGAIVDCTASPEVAAHYIDWMDQGLHVVTPNKLAHTGPMQTWHALQDRRRRPAHYLYETTVGAGLPVVQTLRELIQTGDQIRRIEGIFSGTLSYLFNAWAGERPFSEVVAEARQRGYTEPDPREDLSGMDVARKVVILAREMGLELELADVEVEGLIPEGLDEGSAEQFMAALPAHDEAMRARLEAARADDQVLRFVGRVDHEGAARVALERYPADHPFARIQLTDNIVQFTTRRYHQNPLVVQGPGAGPEVTAGGIFADLLRLASYLGGGR